MGGPSQSTINTQNQLTQEQIGIANQQNQLQEQNYQRMNTLEAPAISYYSGLTSGDASQSLQAAMPFISQISQSFQGTKDSLMNSMPAGAARDLALSNLTQQKDISTANFMTQQVLGAYDKLANMGAGLGSFSLQELGAAMGGLGSASGSNQVAGQMEAAASPWNMVGSLLGDAMGMFSFGNVPKTSDVRLKKNITQVDPVLDKVDSLEVVDYDYIKPEIYGNGHQIGLLAQQVQKVFPDAVQIHRDGHLMVDYTQLLPVCLKAIQELKARIDVLEGKNGGE